MVSVPTSIRDALIAQAHREHAAYLIYLQASAWFAIRHLDGIAKKLRGEANDERSHFESILDYLTLRDQQFVVTPREVNQPNWTDEAQVFEVLYGLEKDNTKGLTELFALARQENEYDTERFVSGLLGPQIESTHEWEGLVEKIKSFTAMPGLIWHLDSII